MNKIFLDVGSHNGQTLLMGMQKFPDLDLYVGVEPIHSLCELARNKIPKEFKSRIVIHECAIDYQDVPIKEVTIFEDVSPHNRKFGSSLLYDKCIREKKEITIKSWDIRYLLSLYKNSEIIFKIDIEGKEYDVFRGMIKHKLFKNIKKIYCEWHWHKVKSITEDRHKNIVKKLNDIGYNLTGDSKKDEFYCGKL